MNLKTKDRLVLPTILPSESTLLMMRVCRELRQALEFSKEETARLNLRAENNQLKWDDTADCESDIPIEPEAFTLILARFKELDTAGKLTLDHVETYEKFLKVITNA